MFSMGEMLLALLLGAAGGLACAFAAIARSTAAQRRATELARQMATKQGVVDAQARALRANEAAWDAMQTQCLTLAEATTMTLAALDPARGIPLAQKLARFRAQHGMQQGARMPPPKDGA